MSREHLIDDQGVYLYCFARPGAARGLTVSGVDGRNRVTEAGVGKAAAVISRVALSEFRAGPGQERAHDPGWVAHRARRHERVVAEVMTRSPVLPVRVGAVFASGKPLEDLLWQREEEVARFFDDVSDKEEWGVKGAVDLDKAGAWLRAADPHLARQAGRLPGSPGPRSPHERRLRAAVHKRLEQWCQGVAREAQEQLKGEAVGFCPLRAAGANCPGATSAVVFDYAFLVPRRRVGELVAHAQRLAAGHREHGLVLEVSGPRPPYNFCPAIGEAWA